MPRARPSDNAPTVRRAPIDNIVAYIAPQVHMNDTDSDATTPKLLASASPGHSVENRSQRPQHRQRALLQHAVNAS